MVVVVGFTAGLASGVVGWVGASGARGAKTIRVYLCRRRTEFLCIVSLEFFSARWLDGKKKITVAAAPGIKAVVRSCCRLE